MILMLSWPVFWAAVAAAFMLGGTFGVMILVAPRAGAWVETSQG